MAKVKAKLKGAKNVKVSAIKWQTGSNSLVYVTWTTGGLERIDHYEVEWQYYTDVNDKGLWFKESTSDTKNRQATYSPPDNALRVRVYIKAVAKDKTVTKTKKKKKKKVKTKKKVPCFRVDPVPSGEFPLVFTPTTKSALAAPSLRLETGTESTILATWKKPGYKDLKGYDITWSYSPENSAKAPSEDKWREPTETTGLTVTNHTYSPPSNAVWVRAKVKPVSNQIVKYGKTLDIWTAPYSSYGTFKITTGAVETIPNVATIKKNDISVKRQGEEGRVIYATWKWTRDHTQNYQVEWEYKVKSSSTWFPGSSETVTTKVSTYTVPENASDIRVRIKPVAENQQSGNPYWSTDWSEPFSPDVVSRIPPDKPPTPSASVDGYTIVAQIQNHYDAVATVIEFEIYQVDSNGGRKKIKAIDAPLKLGAARVSLTVSAGYEYTVRCKALSSVNVSSEWSDFTTPAVQTPPKAPDGFTTIRAASETSVELAWKAVPFASSYDIEYALKKEFFDTSSTVSSESAEGTKRFIEGLTSGNKYWFRLRACNSSDGKSGWCTPKAVVIGRKPSPPTTWSDSSTVTIGQKIVLNWMHNSRDESAQTGAKVETVINGTKSEVTLTTATKHEINTSSMRDGTVILWRVRTKGIINEYSDWSVQRKITVYAPATLVFQNYDDIPDPFTSFPMKIAVVAGPSSQHAVRFFVSVISNSSYETTDFDGQSKMISEGDELYTNTINADGNVLDLRLTPADINLDDDQSYTVKATVLMDTGLTAEVSKDFAVSWESEELDTNAEVWYDDELMVAHITPYCRLHTEDPISDGNNQNLVDETGENILAQGTVANNSNVWLAVYRREFDGQFTEIASRLDGAETTTVTDPHPALDLARYRIVAMSKDSGEIYFNDLPGEVVGETAVIIQWDEKWVPFDTQYDVDAEEVNQYYSGSMLQLPYDIDVSSNYKPDVTLAEYIGRRHPVSYYGTQKGETATWNVNIFEDDSETLYGLRRLAVYPGDVYVREPSGSGYWAHVEVSFSQKHLDLTIPVTLSITRVEGGM